jgi:magnesium transporter
MSDQVLSSLQSSIRTSDAETAQAILAPLSVDEHRRALSMLSGHDAEALVELLPSSDAADLIEHLTEPQAVDLLEDVPPETAANIVHELPSDISGDLLREMHAKESQAIFSKLELDDAEESAELRKRVAYEANTAGGLMTEEVIAFPLQTTIEAVRTKLSELASDYSDEVVQYVYVTESNGRLRGVLRLRDLVMNRPERKVEDVMIPDPHHVSVTLDLEALEDIFEARHFLGLPVTDESGMLCGLVSRTAVQEALAENQAESYLKSSGIVSGEELRSMPMQVRCTRRLAWLAPNIILNIIAASVIAAYEGTLQELVMLAVFLPIVSDMSGCAGNQAVAVSIRELTLGILRPGDYLRVILKEGLLGICNGLVLGCVLGTVAAIWKGNVVLGMVVGGALALNTVLSVLLGGLVPLLLKKFKVDPALASGPILTTCTDMCGFFLVLSFATMTLSKLT